MRKLIWLDINEPVEPITGVAIAVEGFLLFIGTFALVVGFSLL